MIRWITAIGKALPLALLLFAAACGTAGAPEPSGTGAAPATEEDATPTSEAGEKTPAPAAEPRTEEPAEPVEPAEPAENQEPAAQPEPAPTTEPASEPAAEPAPAAPAPTRHVVEIVDFAFAVERLEIKAGDTVVFVNKDAVGHTATAEDGSFDTGLLKKDEEKEIVFAQAGEFPYICTPHPGMKATIVVK